MDTEVASATSATVRVRTSVENHSRTIRTGVLETEVLDGDTVVARAPAPSMTSKAGESAQVVVPLTIPRPKRWSPDSPSLYVLRQRLREGGGIVDELETSFGVRTIRFDPNLGFLLNHTLKLKGVCVHHDAGTLGAAVPSAVWERRLRILKELGVNAIRTSHNPPAPELLDLCDRLGLLVKTRPSTSSRRPRTSGSAVETAASRAASATRSCLMSGR